MSIAGTRDGLSRLSRTAESYWHQVQNIQASQANQFPVALLDGVSHYQFASETIPSTVQDGDLKPTVDLATAHAEIGAAMAGFLHKVIAGEATQTDSATNKLIAPMVSAMVEEGYVNLKPPCNTSDLVNKESPLCFKNSPWVNAHLFESWLPSPVSWNKNISLINNDNFHTAASVFPFHHPEVESTCDASTAFPCVVEHISNTQLSYNKFDDWKLSKAALSAYEIKLKSKSNQYIHQSAGQTDASFELLDQ